MNWSRALVVLALPSCVFAQATVGIADCPQAVPIEVTFESSTGRVDFPHELHTEMEIPREDCHHGSPVTIADETLSSKVVIHRACWECHPTGTGSEASQRCDLCHQREKRSKSE